MKIVESLLLTLIIFFFFNPVKSDAQLAPEVVYLTEKDTSNNARIVPVSNALQDGQILISYSGTVVQKGTLICGESVIQKFKMGRITKRRRQDKAFRVSMNSQTFQLSIPKGRNDCRVEFQSLNTLKFVSDVNFSEVYKTYTYHDEYCNYQESDIFHTNKYPNMSCIHSFDKIELLSESKDSFLKKLEVLLGYKPKMKLIDDQNPYAKLDFSKAPPLDAIFISTLLYQNDFSGQLVSRILKFHASRGTIINIIGTGYMHSEKAKSLFKELTRFSPNIRVQEYKYFEDNLFKKLNLLTNYLRDMHIKLFVTLSKKLPEYNIVITGGRNIHDGFLFDQRPDLSRHPELDQVGEDGSFAYWEDIEFKIQSKRLAESAYAQLLKFWNRNLKTTRMRPSHFTPKAATKTQELTSRPAIRQIFSLPFNDGMALERLYVELIDSAKQSIIISSPYLRPTQPIMDAIQRAIDRKVDISIQTRIDLKGDTQAWLYEETNKMAINELYQHVKIYEWQSNSILHSKLLIVDSELSFIGSVNLSRRSFIQDVENGMLVRSEDFNQELRELVAGYQKSSRIISNEQKRKFWASVIVELLKNQF